ncbi:hypothetical protein K9M79_05155 [Candidatus Woesearchaeota archaeon]|nr:hypothetical protein [Candidatus Woesearchaeota archaeon]
MVKRINLFIVVIISVISFGCSQVELRIVDNLSANPMIGSNNPDAIQMLKDIEELKANVDELDALDEFEYTFFYNNGQENSPFGKAKYYKINNTIFVEAHNGEKIPIQESTFERFLELNHALYYLEISYNQTYVSNIPSLLTKPVKNLSIGIERFHYNISSDERCYMGDYSGFICYDDEGIINFLKWGSGKSIQYRIRNSSVIDNTTDKSTNYYIKYNWETNVMSK